MMIHFLFYGVVFLLLSLWIFLLHCKRRSLNAAVTPPSRGGLAASAIEALPSFKFSAGGVETSTSNFKNWSEDCVVCLGPFEDDETLRLMPSCRHAFHSFCVDVWLRSHATCPYCRAAVVPPPGGGGSVTASSSAALESGGGVVVLEDAC